MSVVCLNSARIKKKESWRVVKASLFSTFSGSQWMNDSDSSCTLHVAHSFPTRRPFFLNFSVCVCASIYVRMVFSSLFLAPKTECKTDRLHTRARTLNRHTRGTWKVQNTHLQGLPFHRGGRSRSWRHRRPCHGWWPSSRSGGQEQKVMSILVREWRCIFFDPIIFRIVWIWPGCHIGKGDESE